MPASAVDRAACTAFKYPTNQRVLDRQRVKGEGKLQGECTRAARVCQKQPESSQKIQQCEDRCFQGALWRITENLHSRCDGALALLHT
ncbi:MAG: hypothetical protein LBV10_06365, partial [Stenotrophomonas sp.]|uniref:hypothetical protein n=1 Tax=Stenotrophomonas sp. TaxID=69392 RepID=UPI00283BDEE0